METILCYVIIAAVGALASILANQSIAVFNDGLRPVLPEYLEKRMDRKALAATSFAIGFGLVIGYGLPTSIAASIILIHCILLTTDIIGTWCPDTKKGMIVSGVIGAVYGVALLFGLQVIIDLFNLLPVNFLGSLGQVSAGITLAFAIFPAVTVALQFGAAKGIITAVVTLLVRQIVETYGKIALDAEHTISLNKDGMALLAGMIIMLVFAAMDKEGNDQNSNEMLTQIFADKVARIRKYMPVLALMGGLIAAGTSMSIMAGDPISLGLLAGLGMTLAVQSSSATIAVLQQVAARPGPDGGCLLGLAGAIPVLLGDNIGTTVTAVLASVGQSRDAKRLAAAHALFNLSGAAVCWLLLPQFTALVRLVSPHGPESAVLARQIANAHTLFNLGCTVLWLPLTPCMVRIVCILLPEKHAPPLS